MKQGNRTVSLYKRRQPGNKGKVFDFHLLTGIAYQTLFRTKKSLQILGGWVWLAGHTVLLVKGSIYRTIKVIYVLVC